MVHKRLQPFSSSSVTTHLLSLKITKKLGDFDVAAIYYFSQYKYKELLYEIECRIKNIKICQFLLFYDIPECEKCAV